MIEFKEGMVCFSGGDSFIQKAIRFFTSSKFSHSFVIVEVEGVLCALETTSTKIVCDPAEQKYKDDDYIEAWSIVDDEDFLYSVERSEICRKRYIGKWYGYLSYLWFIYRWIARMFKHEPKKMWAWASGGITCTELTCKSLPNRLKPDQDENTIAPRELREHFTTIPNLIRFVGRIK